MGLPGDERTNSSFDANPKCATVRAGAVQTGIS